MEKNTVSKATLGRLPEYLKFLKDLPGEGTDHISATAIAKRLNLGEVQVRKDLNSVSGGGKPKTGYVRGELIHSLESFLNCDESSEAVLVGAGMLGKALLEYSGFEEFGVKIIAGFDRDENVIRLHRSAKILPVSQLEVFCKTHKIRIGIITVGKESAQTVCNLMVKCGITAIWNFAPCPLTVPEGILVRQENLALSLAHLKNQLCNTIQEDNNGK